MYILVFLFNCNSAKKGSSYRDFFSLLEQYTQSALIRSIMVKAMDCGIVVSEFLLQSRHYVPFQTNTLWKGMNLIILPIMG